MKKLVILGATSAIAIETARAAASDGCELLLVARDESKLATVSADLEARGKGGVKTIIADLASIKGHKKLLKEIDEALPEYDSILIAYGTLGDQAARERDYNTAKKEFTTNFLSVVSLLTIIANQFEERRRGVIGVITSVAGDRGRQSNYVYGAAKGGLSIFVDGLRNRLAGAAVSVVNIKPGFVDTPMTADVPKNALFATPESVGKAIYKAMKKRKDIVYLPWFWRWIMTIVCAVPEGLFKYQKKI